VTPCVTFCVYRRFRITCRLHIQTAVIYPDIDTVGSKGEEKLVLVYLMRKKLVKCYIWSMALYGAETWTLRAADQKF
jgi:hypothetical protein